MRQLLILGASVRAAAQSAAACGYSVSAADLFADRDLAEVASCVRVANYPTDLLDIRRQLPDVPMMYTGALENYPELLEELQDAGPFWGIASANVRQLRDPTTLERVFRSYDVPFPETVHAGGVPLTGRWLRKPKQSAGGFRVQDADDSQMAACNEFLYQAYVPGPPIAASFVAGHGCVALLGVTDMLVGETWAGAQGFTYVGSIERHADPEEYAQWMRIGKIVADTWGAVGVFGVDAILRGQEVVPIEVNPRFTASMEVLEQASKLSVVRCHEQACTIGKVPSLGPPKPVSGCVGKAVLYARHDLLFPYELPRSRDGVRFRDIPQAETTILAGRPMLSLLVSASDASTARRLLQDCARHTFDLLSADG